MIGVIGLEEKQETPIEERIRELREEGLSKGEIVLQLYEEGYNTGEIMKQGLSLRYLMIRKTRRSHPPRLPSQGELCAWALFFIIDRGLGDDFRRFIQGGVS